MQSVHKVQSTRTKYLSKYSWITVYAVTLIHLQTFCDDIAAGIWKQMGLEMSV